METAEVTRDPRTHGSDKGPPRVHRLKIDPDAPESGFETRSAGWLREEWVTVAAELYPAAYI